MDFPIGLFTAGDGKKSHILSKMCFGTIYGNLKVLEKHIYQISRFLVRKLISSHKNVVPYFTRSGMNLILKRVFNIFSET